MRWFTSNKNNILTSIDVSNFYYRNKVGPIPLTEPCDYEMQNIFKRFENPHLIHTTSEVVMSHNSAGEILLFIK